MNLCCVESQELIMNYEDIVSAIGEEWSARHDQGEAGTFAVKAMGKIVTPWAREYIAQGYEPLIAEYEKSLVASKSGYGRVFYIYGDRSEMVLHIEVPSADLKALWPIPLPQQAVIALTELTGRVDPPIEIINEENRLYANSGLAIALTYYEQYIHPVRDGYKRVFYYTRKLAFPHPYVFTHIDTELAS
ncbi:hypothetical protein BIZ83_gp075 [Erwinia phage vB_EamM_ChrisDB]|uniref:hypothetical protein n=1 Tax=Erwinia phage vB_EamM_ChrisDB TaxID=1883371 RepID=UPI00081D2811|nr:hypothetical protein BIZ83_gp075 [Erwinia phage vB_EamM_ChrisDB]ANZ48778.1 hypothetical protein CHRISDB_216 [Erwinia phage vB_EamM_ChrisDB]